MTDNDGWTTVQSKSKKKQNTQKKNTTNVASYENASNQGYNNSSYGHQDWKDVVLYKKKDTTSKVGRRNAIRSGNYQTVQKYGGGGNRQNKQDGRQLYKLDQTEDVGPVKKIDPKWSKKIRTARNSKQMSHKELAKRANVRVDVVAKFENGTAQPDSATLQKFRNILGI